MKSANHGQGDSGGPIHCPSNIPADEGGAAFGEAITGCPTEKDPEESVTDGPGSK